MVHTVWTSYRSIGGQYAGKVDRSCLGSHVEWALRIGIHSCPLRNMMAKLQPCLKIRKFYCFKIEISSYLGEIDYYFLVEQFGSQVTVIPLVAQ